MMKVVILAGGLGTRIGEETHLKPKPMIEVGDYPILWHIMKTYSFHGFHEFVICMGYRGRSIVEYFNQYVLQHSDVTFDLGRNERKLHNRPVEPWKVTLVHTGLNTMTGGRVSKVRKYVGEETFMLTYGDGLADVDLPGLVRFHNGHGKLATVTAVQPPGRFGALDLTPDSRIKGFLEKPKGDGAWVNGGFFVFEPGVFEYLEGNDMVLEKEPLEKLAKEGQLMAFKHTGFWQPMDTLRDKNQLEAIWDAGNAPWKLWD
jgi:glucose-1-phosphate cytidylyltransferase